MSIEKMIAANNRISAALEKLLSSNIMAEIHRAVAKMRKAFERFHRPFPGVKVTGVKLRSYLLFGRRRYIIWQTEFDPEPRFTNDLDDCFSLGKFYRYDLYIAHQEPLPPTLIIRYGDEASEYISYNPVFVPSLASNEIYAEAIKRARHFGYSWD